MVPALLAQDYVMMMCDVIQNAIIAAAVRQWCRRLSACVRAAVVISSTAFNSDIVFLR